MKPGYTQRCSARFQSGFTLLEMSTAFGILMVIGVAILGMLQQHAKFLEMFRRQSFLAAEAPKIGNLLARILNEADYYFVYANKDEALASGQPTLAPGRAVKLYFKSPNQENVERMIVAEDTAKGTALRFYSWKEDGSESAWTIATRLGGASFQSDQGILNMTLQGPNGELVTYGGGVR